MPKMHQIMFGGRAPLASAGGDYALLRPSIQAYLVFLLCVLHSINCAQLFSLVYDLFAVYCFPLLEQFIRVVWNDNAVLYKGVRRCQEILTNLSAIVELKFSDDSRPAMLLGYRTVTMDDIRLLQQCTQHHS